MTTCQGCLETRRKLKAAAKKASTSVKTAAHSVTHKAGQLFVVSGGKRTK